MNVGKSQASGKLFEKSPYLWRKALIRCAHVSMCDTCTVVWVTQHSALATSHQPIHPTVRHSVAPRFVTTPVRCCARWGENANVNRQTLLRIGSKFMGWVGSAWMGWDDVLPYSRSRISLVSCSAGGSPIDFLRLFSCTALHSFVFSHTQHNTPQNLCSLWPCGFRDSYREALLCARPRHRVHGVENECSSVDYSSVPGRNASLFIHLFFHSNSIAASVTDRKRR